MKLTLKIKDAIERAQPVTLVEKAKLVATIAHEGQTRNCGEPYINHPRRVVSIIREEWTIHENQWADLDHSIIEVIAWLHDVVEDCDVSLENISEWFGPDISLWVSQLSIRMPDDCSPLHRYEVKRAMLLSHAATMDKQPVFVKMADRLDNLRSMKESGWFTRAKYGYAKDGLILAETLNSRFLQITGEAPDRPIDALREEAAKHL